MSNFRKALIIITLVIILAGAAFVAYTYQQQQSTRDYVNGYLNSISTDNPP